ncbi:TonB-linked outer membrane protein, SusC/RagA family [Cyclobacterium lianum]|uniref:TonB-linked outer membrane protein, SusC/RagA family n=1 Tax=Cyclobacterium lianum TaxID=388280 RepID=A0A1M7JZW9_9BACT|nr:TonB-dependent receptor [Cyclobacterium lianum]SHM58273.1 TonB-linked outer membrane protein, SusC/RagA family [Cyclobacterium lianum]
MKNKLLHQLWMFTKNFLFGFLIQCIAFTTLMANDGNAQLKGINEVYVEVGFEKAALRQVFRVLESETGFNFVYSNQEFDQQLKVTVPPQTRSLSDLLTAIARQTGLSFRQVNNNINVKKSGLLGTHPKQSGPEKDRFDVVISGTVSSADDGTTLPGVNVTIKGTTTGTVTDVDGNFMIQVPEGDVVLVFSFVGFEKQEVIVGSQSTINVTLEPDVTALNEVIVVGFGERRVKDLTGSISTVGASTIEKTNMVSPQFALQGNATGVRVVNASGDPNEAPRIFVRGIGTWNGDAQPLYVVDGQIWEPARAGNEDLIGGAGRSTPPNIFNLINPNDIENISVLKDASAAAIYGSRGANGVVLITTKKGQKGEPVIAFNTNFGIQNSPRFDMLNTGQYIDITREMYANNLNPDVSIEQNLYGRNDPSQAVRLTSFSPQFDPESPYYINDLTTYNWQDELVRTNALNQSYDFKISGANDRIDYYVSAGYLDQEGILWGNDYKRYTTAINLNVRVKDWWKVGVNFKYTRQEADLNDKGKLPDYAAAPPWQPLRDPGNPYGFAPVIDPFLFGDTWQPNKLYGQGSRPNYLAVGTINYAGFDLDRKMGQFYTEFTPIQGLSLRGSINLDYTKQVRYGLDAFSRVNIFLPTGINPRNEAPNAPNSLGSFESRGNNIFNYQTDFTASYDRLFGSKHRLTLTAAVQDQRHYLHNLNLSTQNLNNLVDNPKKNGYGNDINNNSSFTGWGQRFWFGLVGRMNYIFDSKYYLDFSYRRDASNGFARDYRWGNFYSVSGAWRLSEEAFMSDVSFINDLKIRGGWGEAGNDQAAVGQYAFLSGANLGLSSYRWGSGSGDPLGILNLGGLVADFPNASLSWEVVTTSTIAVDALLFNNKINLTAELFNRATSNILQRVNLPLSVGTNNPLFNIGKLENRGLDLLVGFNDQTNGFNYGISGNISFLNNEVTRLYQDQPLSTGFGRVEVGRSVGHIWGYKLGGIFQNQEEVDSYFANFEDEIIGNADFVAPGDMYFLDVQGNPTDEERFYSTTPDGRINAFDQTEIGNTIPGVTYGINLNAGWKGFDVSMNFYGEGKVDKINTARRRFESMSGAGATYFTTTLDRWTSSNTDTDMPRAVVNDPAGNNRLSDRWVESAAFFRLNNWQVGYTLPESFLALTKNNIRSLRFYLGGQNNLYLFRWRGIDPVNDDFPLPRSFNMGLNASF